MKPHAFAIRNLHAPRSGEFAAPVRGMRKPQVLKNLAQDIIGRRSWAIVVELHGVQNIIAALKGSNAKTYAIWAGWITVAFFSVYPTLNWLTSLRPHRYQLYVPAELSIPFVPQFVWAYMSMYVLFLLPLFLMPAARMPALGKQLVFGTIASGIVFLILPADLGFTRTIPSDPLYASIFAAIFGVDRPHNLVPSLHVVFSCAILLACADCARRPMKMFLLAWGVLIVASTVLVHQHHLLDVISAILLVMLLRRCFTWQNRAP